MTVTLALRDPCCDKGSIPNKFSSPGEGHRPNTNSVHCNIYQVCGLAPWHTSQGEVEVEEEEQHSISNMDDSPQLLCLSTMKMAELWLLEEMRGISTVNKQTDMLSEKK